MLWRSVLPIQGDAHEKMDNVFAGNMLLAAPGC